MPRKGPAPKRPVIADPVYGSPLVSQLVSKILLNGKKTRGRRRPSIPYRLSSVRWTMSGPHWK